MRACVHVCGCRTLRALDKSTGVKGFTTRGVRPGPRRGLDVPTLVDRFVAGGSGGPREGEARVWVVMLTDMTGRNCDDDFKVQGGAGRTGAGANGGGLSALHSAPPPLPTPYPPPC
jgi:hypothetical protein